MGTFKPVKKISTITGKPEPTFEEEIEGRKKLGANIVRYGAPVAAGMALPASIPGMLLEAGVSGLSEITARQLEKASTDPEIDSLMQDFKAGGFVAASDLTLNMATRGLSKAATGLYRRLAKPKSIPKDVEAAQSFLGNFTPEKDPGSWWQVKKKWQTFQGKTMPFSLTPAQLNAEERSFVSWLEGASRSGIFSRNTMANFDARNIKHVTEAFEKYVDKIAIEKTGPEFGTFLKRILGETHNKGEIFQPAEAYKAYLYRKFDSAMAVPGVGDTPLSLSKLREVLRKTSDPEILSIYSTLKARNLIPELEGVQTRSVRKTRTSTKRESSAASDQTSHSATQKLDPSSMLPEGDLKLRAAHKQTGKTGSTSGETTTTRTSEVLQDTNKRSTFEVDLAWDEVPAEDVSETLRTLNGMWKNGDEAFNEKLKIFKANIEPHFDKFMQSQPNLKATKQAADTYYGVKERALNNAVIQSVRKNLVDKPSAVLSLLDASRGTPATTYDTLLKIKKALYFGANAPSAIKIGKTTDTLTNIEITSGKGIAAVEKLYDKSIIEPLRHRFIASSLEGGVLNPKKFLSQIEKVEKEAPELLAELFGKGANLGYIKKAAHTLEVISKSSESNMWIQLAQAGAIATGGAALTYNTYSGNDPRLLATVGGATAVLLGPRMLAKIFTNANLTRQFTEGISAGPKSSVMGIFLRKIGTMKLGDELFRSHNSQDAIDFYTTHSEEEEGT